LVDLLGKENKLMKLSEVERQKFDANAFSASSPLFIAKAWELLSEMGIDKLVNNGSTFEEIITEKNIKNKNMLECILDTLVTSGVFSYKNEKYYFNKEPTMPTNEQIDFLKNHYKKSLEWVDFVFSKAKITLEQGKAPKETGFDHEKSLELWDNIMEESPYSGRLLTIKKFINNAEEGTKILDLGCGGGIGLEAVLTSTDKKIYLVGAEISSEYLKRAKNRINQLEKSTKNYNIKDNIKRLKFINYSPEEGLKIEGKFDVVFTSLVLNHLTIDERKKLFNSIWNVLRKNGVFASYQLIHISKFQKNPICWIMHTVPTHVEYPFKDEYISALKDKFSSVEEYLGGVAVIAKK